jgi:SAM-dependent methyltransferase
VTEDPLRYHFAFGEGTPYAHAVALLSEHAAVPGGVVIDLGCGFGAVAEPVRALGLEYLGVDSEPAGIKDLVGRGMEVLVGDLGRPEELMAEVAGALGGRPLAAILMLDSLEHLPNAYDVLGVLHRFAGEQGRAPLVVSIPNVTHLDLGVKLLLGRFEMTPTGLLDRTHVRFFSEAGLDEAMGAAGWFEVARKDFEMSQSDQHFPAGTVGLEPASSLGQFLREVRSSASPTAFVNQFVRAYLPGPASRTPSATPEQEPFLSVLVRTQGKRPHTFVETLLSLAAQECADFEVLVLCHDVDASERARIEETIGEFHPAFSERVRVVDVCGGGRSRPLNVGAAEAAGRYLSVLDDDDVALGTWVGELRGLAETHPGMVVRIGVAEQWMKELPGAWDSEAGYEPVDRPRCPYPMTFDLLEHFQENQTPPSGFAVPRSLVTDLGQGWDESLPVYEDWDLLLRAASFCGVADSPVVGALYRRWRVGESSKTAHADHEWLAAKATVLSKIDSAPYLLGRGFVTRLHLAANERSDLENRLAGTEALAAALNTLLSEARAQIADLRGSTSWRLTSPIRRAGRFLATARRRRHPTAQSRQEAT